jgi:membrane associated rhomboid family serine protease
MLLPVPYNVEYVTRKIPWITYSLIGINVFVYLMTILVANFSLPGDRIAGQQEITALTRNVPLPSFSDLVKEADANENRFGMSRSQAVELEDPAAPLTEDQLAPSALQEIRLYQALVIASKKLETPDDIKRLYIVRHAYDNFTDEPHYSILNSFAYRPNEPSIPFKIFSMLTAMFLHGSLDHLLGNMLFLWVFGRATEEFLGEWFFIATYFLSGIAATLMQHLITLFFTPQAMGVPNLGASGAIAGVLGLFAVRFYRTKVRVFYLFGWGIYAFSLVFFFVTALTFALIRLTGFSILVGAVVAAAALYVLGRGNSWGARSIRSIWVIGIWVVVSNLAPALWELFSDDGGNGVAHWAHLGGFICGALYALAIGGVDEGKNEYALEDAQTALQVAGSEEAIQRATALLHKTPNNPAAHEVLAQAHDRRKQVELAARHYNLAIENYWKTGKRDAAARLYETALEKHPRLPLRPSLLLSLSNHYAQNAMWNESALLLTRIVDEFGQSPEAELALLRAAGIWMKQFNDPAEALRMIAMFRSRYPHSEWESQAQAIERASRELLARQQG